MTLSYYETKRLIELALGFSKEVARTRLFQELTKIQHDETEFVAGVMAHGQGMQFTSDQWFDLLSKVPNILFLREHWLMNKLSEKQRQELGLK